MPAPSGRLLPACLLAAAAALALSGCSSSGDTADNDKGEPPVSGIKKITATAGLAFPLDSYERSDTETSQLDRAQNVLVERCMKRYGFAYDAPDPLAPARSQPNAKVFGLVDARTAARYGYAEPPRSSGIPQKTPAPQLGATGQQVLAGPDKKHAKGGGSTAKVPMSLADSRTRKSGFVVNGKDVPIGGCSREAFLELYAPKADAVDVMYVFNLRAESESRALSDSRVKKVTKAWSGCMAKAGYTTADPASVSRDLGITDDARNSTKAIAAAKADVRCKTEVNYSGIRYAVQSAYQKRLIDKSAETLELLKKQSQERLRRAAELTA
ncbi:hypothetical protein OG244_16410 [Streptomyces brevispora]|uniref:hypothetical protein n=1 Tax=Streptomyces brevispora TaxID=887462 RepID=UPI002E34D8ED|nr:hypothetical protein [Streptomyces brevispora]